MIFSKISNISDFKNFLFLDLSFYYFNYKHIIALCLSSILSNAEREILINNDIPFLEVNDFNEKNILNTFNDSHIIYLSNKLLCIDNVNDILERNNLLYEVNNNILINTYNLNKNDKKIYNFIINDCDNYNKFSDKQKNDYLKFIYLNDISKILSDNSKYNKAKTIYCIIEENLRQLNI